jgi:predicted amidophosphoribosyltransferase
VGTITSFCSTCQRDVYIPEEDTPMCPVCSAPLIATVEQEAEPQEESEPTS